MGGAKVYMVTDEVVSKVKLAHRIHRLYGKL